MNFNASPLNIRDVRASIRAILKEPNCQEEIRVDLEPGTYSPEDFHFSPEDSSESCRVTFSGQPGTLLSGGLRIGREFWHPVPAEKAEWFPPSTLDRIRCVHLRDFGLAADDWGTLCAVGAYNTQSHYPNYPKGRFCEAYCIGKDSLSRRLALARYPKKGEFDALDAVKDVGDCAEFPPQNYFRDWNRRTNPRPGLYIVSRATNAHIKNWKHAEDPWIFGYFMWDWADASTPVTIDTDHRRLLPAFVGHYGARAGGKYYFYNISEELATPDEWYLDRVSGDLYFLPGPDDEFLVFNYRQEPVLQVEGAVNLAFRDLEISGTVSDAISAKGDNLLFSRLRIFNVGGNGIVVSGSGNRVEETEICHTGKGGVIMDGGDRATLTDGKGVVADCFIHDFAEVFLTYAAGIELKGVGNAASHNEICNTPHVAILYGGNGHLIEYNYLHHVVLQSQDAGAIYSGKDWAASGTVIRYNRIEDIGSDEFKPDGIYWDDGLSGQTAYGNLLVNVRKYGFMAGGGFDNVMENNLLVDCATPFACDDRDRDGFVHNGWAREHVCRPDSVMWQTLRAQPVHSKPWKDKYPHLSRLLGFDGDPDDPDFPCNPSGCRVCNNVMNNPNGELGLVVDSFRRYSTVEGNVVAAEASADWLLGDPHVVGFAPIPVAEIGRRRGSCAKI